MEPQSDAAAGGEARGRDLITCWVLVLAFGRLIAFTLPTE